MTFEKDLPGIYKKYPFIQKEKFPQNAAVTLAVINELCLDKQRVREAIKKLDKELDSWHNRTTADWTINWIVKELELDE